MNERPSDFALLRDFVGARHQPAFATLVRRHLDLVYGTALRKVGDAMGAEEIMQNVFSSLARKAWQFAPDDSLPAWLHKAALLESKCWLRGELRRRRREQTAAELGTTMESPENQPAFHELVPLLDEALLSLREKDRTALLLRYYESQSLREVGVAFGVSEDTAQKRVQSALQKLTEFFKEHGFKTVSVAATAAALQSAGTAASGTAAAAVVSAALQAAPPLLGLSALLARFASLSRARTGALCAALVALPIGWELKERQNATAEAKRIQTQLLDAQSQYAAARSDLERLRADSQRLELSLGQANEAAMRAAESAKAFDLWKKRMRAQLTANDYRWSDESPFVRIPKSDLPELAALSSIGFVRFSPPGTVEPDGLELLGLTPAERQSLEETLHRHFADVERRREAGIYETNRNSAGQVVDPARPAKLFVVPRLPEDEVKQRSDQLLAELRGILGDERWLLVQSGISKYWWGSESILSQLKQELGIELATDDKGTPRWLGLLSFGTGVTGFITGDLSMFLPEGDPNRTEGADKFADGLSDALRQRGMAWLQEQAIAGLGKKEKQP
jgi:RNA polymerase sigma factor (sigma-70 family)